MNLFEKLKSNILLISFLVITVLFISKTYEVSKLQYKLDEQIIKVEKYSSMSLRLTKEVESLEKRISETPEKIVTIVKEVQSEICDGKSKKEAIKNLPSKKDNLNEKDVVDIDARLPIEFSKLLQ